MPNLAKHVRLTAALLTGLALLAGGMSTAASAAPNAKFGTIKTKNLVVVVEGNIVFKKKFDTTAECMPGRTYLLNNTLKFKTKGVNKVKASSMKMPARNQYFFTFTKLKAGTISLEPSITDEATTNWCEGDQAVIPPAPDCKIAAGKAMISLNGAVPGEDSLIGLVGLPVVLTVSRTSGGNVSVTPACETKAQTEIDDWDVLSIALSPNYENTISFNGYTGLFETKVMALKVGKMMRRSIFIEGSCWDPTFTTTNFSNQVPDPAVALEHNDCGVSGKVDVTVRAVK